MTSIYRNGLQVSSTEVNFCPLFAISAFCNAFSHGCPALSDLNLSRHLAYLCCIAASMRKDRKMTKTHIPTKIGRLLNVFGSAVAVASATRIGHQPVASDLRALGIDPVQFSAIHRS
jgi:hypothetical protein